MRADKERWLGWVVCAVLFLGTLLLFSRAWQNDFVNYDDPDYVTANPHVKAGLTSDGVAWALRSGHASNWHPLTWVSHMVDVSRFGMKPKGHHATSVVLHALNAVLAFVALRALTGAFWASAVGAALFAWHPLRVESVAWVAERKDVLSGFFWFGVLWAYARYARAENERRRWGWYVAVVAGLGLGLMAKPMLVTLPCVLLLLDVWPLRRVERVGWMRLVAEKVPLFVLVAVSSYVTHAVQSSGGAVSGALTLGQRLENAVVAVVRYLGKFFAPVDLAVLYPHPGDWPTKKVVASLVIVLGLTAAAWGMRKRRPWVLMGWLWFLGTLVPVIGIVQVGQQAMADRYTYLPMLGVQIAVIGTLAEMRWATGAKWAATGVVLAVCAGLTWRQIGVWQNSFTLFDHAIAVTERNAMAHNNRGLWLCEAGRTDEGIADYRRALEIRPEHPEANNNLGRILVQQGRAGEAVPLLRRAFEARKGSLEVRNNLANALSDIGALDEAMQHYEEILRAEPRHANALNGYGVALAMKGRAAEAKAKIEESLRIAPDNVGAHNNLGNVCSMLGRWEEAARHYRRATELQPDAHTLMQLGNALEQLGRREEAVGALREALRLRPELAQARAMLEQLGGR